MARWPDLRHRAQGDIYRGVETKDAPVSWGDRGMNACTGWRWVPSFQGSPPWRLPMRTPPPSKRIESDPLDHLLPGRVHNRRAPPPPPLRPPKPVGAATSPL